MKLIAGANGHDVQDGNGGSQHLPSPGNETWLPGMLLKSSTWPQRGASLTLVSAHSIPPQSFTPSCAQCTTALVSVPQKLLATYS